MIDIQSATAVKQVCMAQDTEYSVGNEEAGRSWGDILLPTTIPA